MFGAIATLLYTSFKPFWSELLSGEFPPDQVQGTMLESSEDQEPGALEGRPESQVAELMACAENRVSADDRCVPQTP